MKPNLVVAGLLLLIGILLFGGGYYVGKRNSVVTVQTNPLVLANCPEISPPGDLSFGATTYSLVDMVKTYRKCRMACRGEK